MVYICFLEWKEAAMVYLCIREGDSLVRRGAGDYQQAEIIWEALYYERLCQVARRARDDDINT